MLMPEVHIREICMGEAVVPEFSTSPVSCDYTWKRVSPRCRAQNTPRDCCSPSAVQNCAGFSPAITWHPRSPSWHRHLRQRRSKARQLLRLGGILSWKQRLLLANHHATPLGQRIRLLPYHMGRGRKNNNTDRPWRQSQDGGYYGSYGGTDFKLWKGAYQASPRGPKPSKPQTPAFPPYDASWQNSAALMEVQPAPKPPPSGGGIVYDVQHAINAARKLEQRLQKARSELLQRGRAWDSWVLNMRTAYAKEQERHASVQRRLNSEIAEMEASVKEAYMKVQFAALHQSGSASSSQVPQPLEWESAMDIDSNLSHEQMQAEMHRMIHQAATMDGSSTPTRGTGVPPRTPVRVAPGDPSGSLASDVPIDPYPTPPGFGATPGAQASLDIRTPAPPGLETTSAHGPTLAEKLSDKRRSHRSALAPFGIRPRGSSNEAEDANQVFPGVGTTLLDDDNEELSAVSPGLGRMDG